MNQDIVCGWMGRVSGWARSMVPTGCNSIPGTKRSRTSTSVHRRQRSLVQREESPRACLEPRTHHLAVQASALRTVSNSYNIFVVESFMDEVAARRRARPARVPVVHVERQGWQPRHTQLGLCAGTRSDYYMDQLWISLPWAKEGSWVPYESATVGGALRLANA